MYLLNTFLDEYRLPYMEKQQICKESVFIKNTEELHEVLNQYFQLGKRSEEYVYMAALDSRLNVIGFFEISHGTVNGSYFNNREIFMKALIAGAASIVLAHNGLCSICRTSYKNCERLLSNFTASPKGAVFKGSIVIECPKFKK